ncbi:rcsC [Scenedesmus sp. PABB004]|nr:rcsC [Scenedesmus sp. PABB004]
MARSPLPAPPAAVAAAAAAQRAAALKHAGGGCGTVLVVDDMALNRKLLSAMARKLGFATIEAADGAEALSALAARDAGAGAVAAVLLDLQMPVLDGWATARRLRALEAVQDAPAARLPIIACTACDLASDAGASAACAAGDGAALSVEQHTLACGVDVCLHKPLSLERLTAALRELRVLTAA